MVCTLLLILGYFGNNRSMDLFYRGSGGFGEDILYSL